MPFKPNKAPLVKALFVIVLVARSTMWLATADLSPENALRTFQASGTLDMDLTPHVSKQKRYLRSAADVTTTSTGELRRLVSDLSGLKEFGNSLGKQAVAFPARLRRNISTIFSTIVREKLWLWVNKQKEPKEAFTSLQLDNGENPFENPKFSVWKYIVEKTKPERDVPREMFNIMVKALGDEGILAKFLAQAKSSTQFEDTVNSLYNHQIEQWLQYDYYTPKNVYNLLHLNKYDKIGEVPGRPEFSMWAAFNTRKESVEKAFEFLKEPKRKIINPDLMRALAKIGEADGNYEFAQDLLYFQIQYLIEHPYYRKSSFKLFKLQGEGTLNPTDLTTDPLGRLWVDYVYMRAQDEDGFTGLGEVFKKLELRAGHKAAVAVMKMVHKDGYFLKSLEKEKPIKEKENFDSFLMDLQEKMANDPK
ncbi:unnamed protein product [Peronospora farinosa]|uniref:Secreted RxLR effector peptide protein n=1 Tax=Peronospora farinosa TaxID=134698 RepID=A0AAV0SU03_9STRA|nr:unnamed protein product [Peronospora farinosa]